MFTARVIGNVTATFKHEAYANKKLLIVRPVDPDNWRFCGKALVAVDYMGAGVGDIVLVGEPPGAAAEVFGLARAPISTMVLGILDEGG